MLLCRWGKSCNPAVKEENLDKIEAEENRAQKLNGKTLQEKLIDVDERNKMAAMMFTNQNYREACVAKN